jgi:hypothetical protein
MPKYGMVIEEWLAEDFPLMTKFTSFAKLRSLKMWDLYRGDLGDG